MRVTSKQPVEATIVHYNTLTKEALENYLVEIFKPKRGKRVIRTTLENTKK